MSKIYINLNYSLFKFCTLREYMYLITLHNWTKNSGLQSNQTDIYWEYCGKLCTHITNYWLKD